MMRRTLSLLLVFVAVLFLSCEDQLVSPETSTYLDGSSSAALTGSSQDGASKAGNGVKAAGSYSTHKLSPDTRKELAQLRRATARYQDVTKAQADGYGIASPFVPGMGFHYVNMSLVPDGEIDVAAPEALVYDSNDPQQKSRNLGAVEYIIPGPNTEAFQQNLPTPFTGQTTDDWHYEGELGSWTLHVWIWLDNPEGFFHPTNPRVSHGAPTP